MNSGSTGTCKMSPTIRRYLSADIVQVDLYCTSCFPSAPKMIKLMNCTMRLCGISQATPAHALCWGQSLAFSLQIEEISSTGVLETFFYWDDSEQVAPVATDILVLKGEDCFCCCPSQEAELHSCSCLGQCSPPPPPVVWQNERGQEALPVLIHSTKWFVSDLFSRYPQEELQRCPLQH